MPRGQAKAGRRAAPSLPWSAALALLAALTLWGARAYHQAQLRAGAERQLAMVAELKRGQLVAWMDAQRRFARAATEGTAMAVEVERWLQAGPAVGDPRPRWASRLRILQELCGCVDVSVSTLDGQLVVGSTGRRLTLDADEVEALRGVARTGAPVLTSIHRDPDFGDLLSIDLVAPMIAMDAGGRRAVAAMVLRMDAAASLFPPIQAWPVPSETAEVVLAERRGDAAVFLTELRHRKGRALEVTVPTTLTENLMVQALAGNRGLLRGVDYRRVPALGVARAIDGTHWLLLAKEDEGEVFVPLLPRTLTTAGLGLAFLLSVLLAVRAWLRQRAGALAAGEVREARRMLEAVLDAIPARVFWKDRELRYLGCNRAFAADAGVEGPEALVGLLDDALPWAEQAAAYQADDRAVMASGAARVGYEEQNTRADGTIAWVRTSKIPLRGPGGEIQGLLGTYEDLTPQKQAEAAASAGQARIKAMFENAGFGISITDPEGRFIETNPAYAVFLGYTLEEVRELRNVDVTHVDDLPETRRQLRRVYEGEINTYSLEKRYVRKEGQVVWGLLAVTAIRDALGQVKNVIGIVADITERKRIESELALTAERLALATEGGGIGIWDWDVMHDILVWDDHMYRLYGLRREDFTGAYAAWTRALDPAELERADGELQAALRGEREFTPEFRVRWPDGSIHYLQAAARTLRDGSGRPVRMVGINIDVTARRQAEDRIRESERFLKEVTDTVPGLVGYWTSALRCTFANEHYRDWFGLAPEQVVGRTMREVLGDALFERNAPYVAGALAGERQRFEQTITRPDGTVGYTWAHYIPDTSGGAVRGFYVLVSDISELKTTQLELERLNAALQERTRQAEGASRAKSDFLANMSHEIRTPMNAIMGLSQLLARSELGPKQRDYLDRMRAASRNLLGLLNDILDLSKIEAQRLELERIPFELMEVLRHVEGLTSERAREKGLSLRCEVPAGVPLHLVGDPLRLGQVLVNLASNAVKFTEAGRVELGVRRVRLEGERVKLRFAVTDTGIGIPPEALPLVFEAFSQADSSTTRRFGGTGLGLAISRRLVGLMGGELSVQSCPGEGSTFSFELELAVQPRGAAAAPGSLAGRRVLVVDNDPEFCGLVAGLLSGLGMDIRTVASGAEAIEALAGAAHAPDGAYDVVLLDWRMPGVDGLETARRVRAEQIVPQPLLVLATAFAREYLGLDQEAPLFDGYVLKPIEPDVLRDVLLEALRKRDAQLEVAREDPRLLPGQPPAALGRQGRVLLVEDNETNRMVAREFLESAGLVVEEARNGREAVDQALRPEASFDLVLMDIQMPEMDGFEATARIRAVRPELAIVAMTAHAMEAERRRCLEAGMQDHIAKPFEAVEFLRVIERWLARGSVARSNLAARRPGRAPAPTAPEAKGYEGPDGERFLGALRRDVAAATALLREATVQADPKLARKAAHVLKGLALPAGFQGLRQAARALDRAVQDGDPWLALAAAVEDAARPLAESARTAPGAGSAAAKLPVDAVLLRPLLEALAAKLRRRSLGAKEQVDAVRACVGADPHLHRLEDALDGVRFGEAEAALRALAAAHGVPLGG